MIIYMKQLFKAQERGIKQRIKQNVDRLSYTYKKQKIEERNLYDYLKKGFPTNRSVLFFDDLLENIEATNKHSRRIIPVYLPFEEVFMFKHFDTKESLDNIKSNFRNNDYVDNMVDDTIIKSNGITNVYTTVRDEELPSIEQRLYDWILQTVDHKQRYAFFDWDYTLNVYGGFSLINQKNKTLDDTLLVLLGGKERLENIRNMLQFLINHDVKIYIITANPQADHNKGLFLSLIHRLIDNAHFSAQQLVYVDTYKTEKYKIIHEIISRNNKSTHKRQRISKNRTEKR